MAFTFAAFCYIVALILSAVLIFLAIFHIIAFDELKTDYKNPIDQCSSLNPLVLPEYALHMFFTILFIFAFQLGSLLWNLPLAVYHIRRYMNRPVMSCTGLYDPTTIMNADELNRAQREGWAKLCFYLVSFFYYLYRMAVLGIMRYSDSFICCMFKLLFAVPVCITIYWPFFANMIYVLISS